MATTNNSIDLVISFDTTGSMYPCLAVLRETVAKAVKRLFKDIPELRVGIIAHGDYCDSVNSYVTKILDLTTDEDSICRFVKTVSPTNGGDTPECYELVLHQSRSLAWQAGKSKVLVLIGDDIPHGPSYVGNTKKLDWRNELGCLQEMGVSVYGVQALNKSHATKFYEEVAHRTGGFHLTLDQFSNVVELILAIAFKQSGDEILQNFEQELITQKKMNRSMDKAIGSMLKKKSSSKRYEDSDFNSVPSGRFQVMIVQNDCSIKDFVENYGISFNIGRGFYEFTKKETIQKTKEVVLMDRDSGDMFSGPKARQLIGLSEGVDMRISPASLEKYIVFVQSTSSNRKLLANTRFLYEVKDY